MFVGASPPRGGFFFTLPAFSFPIFSNLLELKKKQIHRAQQRYLRKIRVIRAIRVR
jgi:hypothetical protein